MVKRISTYYFLVIGVLLLFFAACKKEDENAKIPSIEIVQVSSTQIEEYRDSIFVVISYEDGDGDIGQQNREIGSLEVKDSRYTNPEPLIHIPPVTPAGAEIKVRGSIKVFLPTLIRLSELQDEEITTLNLRLRDRAGNWSNTVSTPAITITAYQGEW